MGVKKFLVSLVTIAAIVLFGFTLERAIYRAPREEIPLSSGAPAQAGSTEASRPKPERLRIPAIAVEARIEEVGITKRGNMAAPRSYYTVGWYKYGTVPGEVGSAVLAGHLNNGLAMPGVFSNLDEAKVGDDIIVETSEGKELHYMVTRKDVYNFDTKVPEVFDEDNARLLRLITCTGNWIAQYKTHGQRLVVTAQLNTTIE